MNIKDSVVITGGARFGSSYSRIVSEESCSEAITDVDQQTLVLKLI